MRHGAGQTDNAPRRDCGEKPGRWLLAVSLAMAAVAALVSGCSDASDAQVEIPGTYKQTVPAGDGLEQISTLELRADFKCSLSREYVKKGTAKDSGTWTNQGKLVTVTLKAKRTNHPPTVLEFKWSGKKVVATKWDEALYGSDGPGTFLRQ